MHYPFVLIPFLGGAMRPHSRHSALPAAESRVVEMLRTGQAEKVDVQYFRHHIGTFTLRDVEAVVAGDPNTFLAARMDAEIRKLGDVYPRVAGKRKQEVFALIQQTFGVPDEKAIAFLGALRPYLR